MTTQNIPQDIANATKMLQTDVGLTHQIVHGDETTEVPTEGGPVPSHAKVAEDGKQWIQDKVSSTIGSIEEHADYVDGKTVEADQHAGRSEAAADRAEEISGIEDVQEALRLAAVPAPDFDLPLISDLQIQEGFGDPDTIEIGGESYELPTRSASFSRASAATYVNKSGVLTTAGVNEPRFEKNGVLIEGASTNYIRRSEEITNTAVWRHDGETTVTRSVSILAPNGKDYAFEVAGATDGTTGGNNLRQTVIHEAPLSTQTAIPAEYTS